ncbi:MAG: flagellar hook-basal body complex protein FliE [Kiritimatiellae bacterium]|nr:flagellar hook-basal body complex protein FliE [Kiritimatiellia bacterium]
MNMMPENQDLRIGLGEGQLEPAPGKAVREPQPGDLPFKDVLKGLIDQVDSLQKEADASIEGLITGETTNIHDVVVKLEEAGIAFDLMMQVRNKLLEAYQSVVKMQP